MKKKLSFGTQKKCFCSTNVIQMTFIMSFILLFIKFLCTEVCTGTSLTNRCIDLCNILPLKLQSIRNELRKTIACFQQRRHIVASLNASARHSHTKTYSIPSVGETPQCDVSTAFRIFANQFCSTIVEMSHCDIFECIRQ